MRYTKLLLSRIKACFIACVGTRFYYFISLKLNLILYYFRILFSKKSSQSERLKARTEVHVLLTYIAVFALLFHFGYAVHCYSKTHRQLKQIEKLGQELNLKLKPLNLIFED